MRGGRRRPGAPERLAAIALGAGRAAIGVGFWLAPALAGRALGFGELDRRALAMARIAATRDLVLAGWALDSLEDRERLRRASIGVVAADAGDAVAFALLLGAPSELRTAAPRGLAAAVPATVAGAWLVARLRR